MRTGTPQPDRASGAEQQETVQPTADLTGKQIERFRDVLVAAFDRGELEQLTRIVKCRPAVYQQWSAKGRQA